MCNTEDMKLGWQPLKKCLPNIPYIGDCCIIHIKVDENGLVEYPTDRYGENQYSSARQAWDAAAKAQQDYDRTLRSQAKGESAAIQAERERHPTSSEIIQEVNKRIGK